MLHLAVQLAAAGTGTAGGIDDPLVALKKGDWPWKESSDDYADASAAADEDDDDDDAMRVVEWMKTGADEEEGRREGDQMLVRYLDKRRPGWGKRAASELAKRVPGWGKRAAGGAKRRPGWGKRADSRQAGRSEGRQAAGRLDDRQTRSDTSRKRAGWGKRASAVAQCERMKKAAWQNFMDAYQVSCVERQQNL